uniref:Uncharacterized protein n=1 Tax=Rhinolophus ferrumequinum TaxID=59479 RepID=A0A671DHA9_RHIFE
GQRFHIVHFYSTCAYSHMLRTVLAFDELLLTVSTEILFQWTNIVAWQQMPAFWGNSSKSTRDPGWFVGFFVFFSLLNQQGCKEGREVMNYSFW